MFRHGVADVWSVCRHGQSVHNKGNNTDRCSFGKHHSLDNRFEGFAYTLTSCSGKKAPLAVKAFAFSVNASCSILDSLDLERRLEMGIYSGFCVQIN